LIGATIIAYFTTVAQVALACSVAWGYGFTVLAYVLWWIGMAWMIVQCSTPHISLSKERLTEDEHPHKAVFLPILGAMTAASIGGIICNNSVHLSARMASLWSLTIAPYMPFSLPRLCMQLISIA
jgi:tellurite resistance protein TehA-like permease